MRTHTYIYTHTYTCIYIYIHSIYIYAHYIRHFCCCRRQCATFSPLINVPLLLPHRLLTACAWPHYLPSNCCFYHLSGGLFNDSASKTHIYCLTPVHFACFVFLLLTTRWNVMPTLGFQLSSASKWHSHPPQTVVHLQTLTSGMSSSKTKLSTVSIVALKIQTSGKYLCSTQCVVCCYADFSSFMC